METTTARPTFKAGDRVTSIYGHEHRGAVVKVASFRDGAPMYHVKRDSDGFVWIGMPFTMLRESDLS